MRVFNKNFIRADGISRNATGVTRSSKQARAGICVPVLGEGEGTFRLFVEGDALFDEMIAAIERATRDIRMESYIFAVDEVGARFVAALAAKARRP